MGVFGTDPTDWGSDFADLIAPKVLAKAAYERRRNRIVLLLWLVAIALFWITIVLCFSWLVSDRQLAFAGAWFTSNAGVLPSREPAMPKPLDVLWHDIGSGTRNEFAIHFNSMMCDRLAGAQL